MNIIVTGAAGFIGSHLVDELLRLGHTVTGIDDLSAGKLENLTVARQYGKFRFIKKSVLELVTPDMDETQAIYHLAASKKTVSLANPYRDLQVNAAGTLHILGLSKALGIQRFIHASTGSVYGEQHNILIETSPNQPVSFYGISKLAGEKYVLLYNTLGLLTTALRFFHVYGPRQESADEKGGVIAIFCRRLVEGLSPIIYGDGTQVRSFTYVMDIVRACTTILEKPETTGQVYNVASGLQITINQLATQLIEFSGKASRPIYKDWVYGDIKDFTVSNIKLRKLGFKFETSFATGLQSTWEYYKNSQKGE